MDSLWQSVRRNKLLKDNSVLFVGSLFAAGLNYLYYPVLGRFLHPAQFGEVQVLAALVVQSALLFGFARIAIMSEVANAKDEAESRRLLQFAERLLLQLAAVLTLLALFVAPLVAHALQYESVLPIYIVIPSLVLNALRSSRDAYARVTGHFGVASATDISASLSKLVLSTVLAAIGLGTVGAVFGMLAAYIVSAVVMVVLTARWGLQLDMRRLWTLDALRALGKRGAISKRGALTLSVSAAGLVAVLMSTIHTVAAKAALPPAEAGLFAGIAVVASIVFFATSSIAAVLMASIRPAAPRAGNVRQYVLSALLMGVLSLGIVAVFYVFPAGTTQLLLGVKYVTASDLLPTLTIAMLAMAGTNLIIAYHVAMRDKYILPLSLVAGGIVGGSLVVWHGTAALLAAAFMGSNLIAFALCLGWTVFWHKRMYNA